MEIRSPEFWKDYELIDCGNFEKLERWGNVVTVRPEPQAFWPTLLSEQEWNKRVQAHFTRDTNKKNNRDTNSEAGGWRLMKPGLQLPILSYRSKQLDLSFKLQFTSFGHVGVFPEQADNWEYIAQKTTKLKQKNAEVKVLNLFAYTGGASLAACSAGADVTHVDAVRNVVSWANENRELSKLGSIRWVVEDALKFARREVKREKKYAGIVLDPPAYGRGPDGEKWVLEEHLSELVELCSKLLADDGFLVLSLYSLGLSALVSENLAKAYFKNREFAFGELCIPSVSGYNLPLGSYLRI